MVIGEGKGRLISRLGKNLENCEKRILQPNYGFPWKYL